MPQLRTPEDVKALLQKRFERHHGAWLLGDGEWPWRIPLGSPTESEVVDNVGRIRDWVLMWSDGVLPLKVEHVERIWPHMGRQKLPSFAIIESAEQIAHIIGTKARWLRAVDRAAVIQSKFPSLVGHRVLARHFDVLASYSEADFQRLVALLQWGLRNETADLYLRQLPIEGLDTKWIGARKGVVRDFLLEIAGSRVSAGDNDLETLLGLRRAPHRLRLRVLCPQLRPMVGGLCDIEAPFSEIAELPLSPLRVLIVENLETGLAMPDVPNAVVFMKLGVAVSALEAIPWLALAERAVYWGDIDTHGFVILDRARRALPQLESVLMDEQTLEKHLALCVLEPDQATTSDFAHLLAHERGVVDGLYSGRWGLKPRLEQERLHWPTALQAVLAALD